MKTYQPGNTRYDHNHSDLKPADRRARDITSEYIESSRSLIGSMLLMLWEEEIME